MTVKLIFIEVDGAREAFGASKFDFDLKGNSVRQLVKELMDGYGERSAPVFLRDGRYNENLQVILNWRTYVPPDRTEEPLLSEGDTVIFAPYVGGG